MYQRISSLPRGWWFGFVANAIFAILGTAITLPEFWQTLTIEKISDRVLLAWESWARTVEREKRHSDW